MKNITLLITTLSILLSYYLCVLPHEWSHGLFAWIFGYKSSPFDIKYGGLLMLHCDENVPYDKILASGSGLQAAMIGIAGITYNALMLLLSFVCLNKKRIRESEIFHRFFYWFAVFNLCPILGYIPNGTFSTQGDVGRFVSGLHISPWFVFIPGTLIVAYMVYNILAKKLYGLFEDLMIKHIMIHRLYLWFTIFILFFLLYTHGYNPFSDHGASFLSKSIAAVSIIIAVVLTYVYDPKIGRLAPKHSVFQDKISDKR